MMPILRKSLTVDVIRRERVEFRLHARVYDRSQKQVVVIVVLQTDGAVVRNRLWNGERWETKFQLTPYSQLRPQDGRKYA